MNLAVKIGGIAFIVIIALLGIKIYALSSENSNLSERVTGCSKELGVISAQSERYRKDALDAAEVAAAATGNAEKQADAIRRLRNDKSGDIAPVLSDTYSLLNQLQLEEERNSR